MRSDQRISRSFSPPYFLWYSSLGTEPGTFSHPLPRRNQSDPPTPALERPRPRRRDNVDEPWPGRSARGRYAAFMPPFILSVIVVSEFSLRSARPPLLVVGSRPLAPP